MPRFSEALSILQDRAKELFSIGHAFERLMQIAQSRDPGILCDRLECAQLWHEWPDSD